MRRIFLAAGLLIPAYAHAHLTESQPSGGVVVPAVTVAQATSIQSASIQSPSVRADQPWARATAPQQKVGAAYVTLTSPMDDRLLSASSPVAGKAELHEMTMNGGVMRMREQVDGLALPAGKAVTLAPGGLHIMLTDLRQPLVAGQTIPVQLRFEHAPPLDLELRIAPIGAQGPGPQRPANEGQTH